MICTFKVTRYYLQMCLEIFATIVLKYMSLIQLTFFSTIINMVSMHKKTGVQMVKNSFMVQIKPDVPDNFKKYKTKTIPKNIILPKSKYDLKTRY